MSSEATFATARALHEAGEWEAAFDELTKANAKLRAGRDVRTAAMASTNAHHAARANYSAPFLSGAHSEGSALRPIFIVGMPRCGSTLTEQILDCHPSVQALSETAAFLWAERSTSFLQIQVKGSSAVVEHYLRGLVDEGWDGETRWVDKFLANYMRIGLIHLCFRNAAIIHVVRDPLDTCFSEYRSIFNVGHDYMYDLGDIGREYVRYRKLMEHWHSVLPGRIIDVRFEDLVTDPQTEIPKLIAACGLPWDPACLRPDLNPRDGKTASKEQIKQPINTQGIGAWKPYEKHLGPLIDALGPYIDLPPRP